MPTASPLAFYSTLAKTIWIRTCIIITLVRMYDGDDCTRLNKATGSMGRANTGGEAIRWGLYTGGELSTQRPRLTSNPGRCTSLPCLSPAIRSSFGTLKARRNASLASTRCATARYNSAITCSSTADMKPSPCSTFSRYPYLPYHSCYDNNIVKHDIVPIPTVVTMDLQYRHCLNNHPVRCM
jgi:hypothetical protein